jgi:aromatic ring hydroxylase
MKPEKMTPWSAPRIQDMLAWLAMYADLTEALGKAANRAPVIDRETGFAMPKSVYTNCAKFFFAHQWHEAMKYVQDIISGIAATIPSQKDYDNPTVKSYMNKYLQGDAKYPSDRKRVDRSSPASFLKALLNRHINVPSIY